MSEVIQRERLRFGRNVKVWEDMLFCLEYLTRTQKVSYVGRPIYALNLVAALGKPGFQDKATQEQILKTVDGLRGRLPVKHAMKRFVFRHIKFAAKFLWGRR